MLNNKPGSIRARFLILVSALCVTTGFFNPVNAQSKQYPEINLSQLEHEQLSKNPMWRRLLAFRPNESKSQVISEDFFLHKKGNINPLAELKATLKALAEPINKQNANNHVICTKPARTHYIDTHLRSGIKELRNKYCTKLNNWLKTEQLDSISIMMVSGYFGNPASTFGHALIKFNTTEQKETVLDDISINFGALIPPNENTMVYVFKGLFGYYEAGFSDRQYYLQDLIYSRTESRDIWEYKLKMDEDRLLLAAYYLFELAAKKYQYFFLDKNCAYRVTELLEVIYDKDLHGQFTPWYLPVESFHSLQKLREEYPEIKIIGPEYIPSIQRKILYSFEKLTPEEQESVNKIILQIENIDELAPEIKLPEHITIDALNFMLDYMTYQYRQEDGEYAKKHEYVRNKIISKRFTLPAQQNFQKPDIQIIDAPSSGSKPHEISIYTKYNKKNRTQYGFRFSAASFKSMGFNKGQLSDSDLVALEIDLGHTKRQNLFLEKVDLIQIKNLNTNITNLANEKNTSWLINTGIRRRQVSCFNCHTGFIEGALGYANKKNDLVYYAMLGGYYSSANSKIGAGPYLGLTYQLPNEKFKFALEFKYDAPPPFNDKQIYLNLKGRYIINKDLHVSIDYLNQGKEEFMLSLNKYF